MLLQAEHSCIDMETFLLLSSKLQSQETKYIDNCTTKDIKKELQFYLEPSILTKTKVVTERKEIVILPKT